MPTCKQSAINGNHMVRTQIQLTEQQSAALRAMAVARHVSVAELIRISVDHFVTREAVSSREAIVARAKAVVGRFASDTNDGSTAHDRR